MSSVAVALLKTQEHLQDSFSVLVLPNEPHDFFSPLLHQNFHITNINRKIYSRRFLYKK